jgi:hypothetical protein
VREGFAPSDPQYFNSARWDEFDRWSATRRDERLGTASTQYLPSELSVYASTFDQYGTWRYDDTEGAVWYPTVRADWRPYSVGYWRTYPAWGEFWIGGDPWGWPTHHYGHWGFSFSFGWYWRPAPVWGPAWVYWAYSPGYVSWCPLGRYGYPVFGHFGVRGHYYGNHVDPWRGWTVVPRHHYGSPTPVHRVAVDGRRLDPAARGAFTPGRPGAGPQRAVPRPTSSGVAVPRNAAGGATAAPRGNAGRAAPAGGLAAPGSGSPTAGPRAGGSRALPDGRTRLSPDEAARVFAGGSSRTTGTATRRPLPAAPALGSLGRRTEAPAATPDVTAFGNRRSGALAVPRERAGASAPAPFGTGAPSRFGSGPPAQSGSSAPGTFGSGARARTYPRATPSPEAAGGGGWSPTPAVRANPYIRGDSGAAGAMDRRAYPRAVEPSTSSVPRGNPYGRESGGPASQPVPRSNPYMRGSGMPSGQPAPRVDPSWRGGGVPSGQSAPRANPPTRGSGGAPAPSARPRDGGGMPSGTSTRGGSGGSSSRQAAPRYNPGSGASQPRGGGSSSPPPRRRGGTP